MQGKCAPSRWEACVNNPTNLCEPKLVWQRTGPSIRAENSKIVWFSNYQFAFGKEAFFCPNSLKSQMSKKSRVVKTYGRHKHRTVKAQIWLSPDENVHSPFGNGYPSKIEASSSKNVFKPKSSKW